MIRIKSSPFILALILCISILLPPSIVEAKTTGLTRGEFFKLLAEHMTLKPEDTAVKLPVDVKEKSDEAEAIRTLLERKIIFGYPDGTIRLNELIKPLDVEYIIARFLGITDDKAIHQMKTEFQVSLGDDNLITKEQAESLIEKILLNDRTLMSNLTEVMEQMKAITSVTVNTSQTKQIKLTQSQSSKEITRSIETSSEVYIHKQSGYQLKSFIQSSDGTIDQGSVLEQYVVPEGLFNRRYNADLSDKGDLPKWIKGVGSTPFDYGQMLAAQIETSIPKKLMNDRYYFYRSLGVEEIDGKKIHKIQVFGSMPIATTMNQLIPELDKSEKPLKLIQTISGTIYVDIQTNLLTELEWVQTIRNDVDDSLPFKLIEVETKIQYSDYNQVKPIQLPENK
ncbi:S-layer homology domain-containing protein [Paenibacillus albiflavus]|uniref:S-layer homology domain-containing protein n=1 Tax=Paenibacillus albiflavus TaxID=2545760 RepID=A0A4R4E3Y8_9BACL|nr:S-layer homology domain-containing protein [Paenibacillus albiflavus]TCZ72316.1 S-layer homology domain-containing protein [Paenibacillus albiflavus]